MSISEICLNSIVLAAVGRGTNTALKLGGWTAAFVTLKEMLERTIVNAQNGNWNSLLRLPLARDVQPGVREAAGAGAGVSLVGLGSKICTFCCCISKRNGIT